MKRMAIFLTALVLILSLSVVSLAHSGRTDSSGGHWNHSTGEYHYHHGKPAHDHINGVCPYDYEDTTSHRSNNYSSPQNKASTEKTKYEPNFWRTLGEVFFFLFLSLISSPLLGVLFLWLISPIAEFLGFDANKISSKIIFGIAFFIVFALFWSISR